MPTKIDALLADACAAVYNRRHKLVEELNRLQRIENDYSSQINSLNERLNGLGEEHQKAWIAGNRNPELKKDHANIGRNIKSRIKKLENQKSKNNSVANKTNDLLQNLKVRIDTFTKTIESIR